jgi:hypothetical protein
MWIGLALVGGSVSFAIIMLVANLAFLSPQTLRSCWSRRNGEQATTSATPVSAAGKPVLAARR